jgi:hypothetical protein
MVTKLLDDALKAGQNLSPEAQDTIARVVLRLACNDDEARGTPSSLNRDPFCRR